MSYDQEARDANNRLEIELSCRRIKREASYIGVAAEDMAHMPRGYAPGCMDELNEAMGVLQRALERIEKAKQFLMSKQLEAAE